MKNCMMSHDERRKETDMKKLCCIAAAAMMLFTGCAKKADPVSLKPLTLYGEEAGGYESYQVIGVAQDEEGQNITMQQALEYEQVFCAYELSSEADLPEAEIRVYKFENGTFNPLGQAFPVKSKPGAAEVFGLAQDSQQGFVFSAFEGAWNSDIQKVEGMTFNQDLPFALSVRQETSLEPGQEIPLALIYQAEERPKLDLPDKRLDDLSASVLSRLENVYGVTLTLKNQ